MSDARVTALWDLLARKAAERQTITYGEAAKKVGGIARGVGAALVPIQTHCRAKRLPDLSVLVVRADTGKQGAGFGGDPEREKAGVFAHDWSVLTNPFADRGRS